MITLLLSFASIPGLSAGQTPVAPAGGAQAPPAAVAPKPVAPRPAAQSSATVRTAMLITATNPSGATLPDVRVVMNGPAERDGTTDASGTIRFTNLRAGTYRVRFSGERVITFEREVVVRSGQTADVDVTLNAAEERPAPPPPPPPPPAPAPPAPPIARVGPAAKPGTIQLLDLLEKEFIGKQARRESLLSCSGNARTTMIQLNEQQAERLYGDAESMYYVMGGEGTVRINGSELALTTGAYVIVPRGASHSLIRRGRRPLILLAVLSGEPCDQAQP